MKNKNKKIKKQKRHNKYYAGKLTKREKEIRSKWAIRTIIFGCLFATSYAFAMASNDYSIANKKNIIVEEPKVEVFAELPVQTIIVTKETIETNEMQIRILARKYNFKYEDYLVNLACCEGLLLKGTINDKGNTPWYSIDRGLYGINDYWHKEVSDECAFDLECSTIWTMERINTGFQYEWMCDVRIKGNKNYTNEYCY